MTPSEKERLGALAAQMRELARANPVQVDWPSYQNRCTALMRAIGEPLSVLLDVSRGDGTAMGLAVALAALVKAAEEMD